VPWVLLHVGGHDELHLALQHSREDGVEVQGVRAGVALVQMRPIITAYLNTSTKGNNVALASRYAVQGEQQLQ
jgi:hypothetical protein